jgi:MoxR-like ATPase
MSVVGSATQRGRPRSLGQDARRAILGVDPTSAQASEVAPDGRFVRASSIGAIETPAPLEAAREVLAVARAEQSFGAALHKRSGPPPLEAHYSLTLNAARAVASIGRAAADRATSFLEHQVSVPSDLREDFLDLARLPRGEPKRPRDVRCASSAGRPLIDLSDEEIGIHRPLGERLDDTGYGVMLAGDSSFPGPERLALADASVQRIAFVESIPGARELFGLPVDRPLQRSDLKHWFGPEHAHHQFNIRTSVRVALMNLWSRAAELGIDQPTAPCVSDFAVVSEALPMTDSAAIALLRLARAFGEDPAKIEFHGRPLTAYRLSGFEPGLSPRRKDAFSSKNAGRSLGDDRPTRDNIWILAQAKDDSIFRMMDDRVSAFGASQLFQTAGRDEFLSYAQRSFQHPGWFSVFARALEISIDRGPKREQRRAAIREVLECGVPEAWVSPPDGFDGLIRLAHEVGASLPSLTIITGDGDRYGLLDHPAFPPIRRDPAIEAELAASLAKLDPVSDSTPGERSRALDLVLTGDSPAFELHEILAAARAGRRDGTIAQSEIADPAPLLDRMIEIWHHPGSVAVLAGALLRISRGQLAEAFDRRELPDADRWAGVAAALEGLEGPRLALVLSGIDKPFRAPSLDDLERRVSLAAADRIEEIEGRLAQEMSPIAVVPLLLGLAEISPEPLQGDLIQMIERWAAEKRIDPEYLHAIAPEGLVRALESRAEEGISRAIDAYLDKSPQQRRDALEALAREAKSHATFVDEGLIASFVLDRVYRGELERGVIPLERADQELGVVAPMLRTEALDANATADRTVAIAGIDLLVNNRSDRIARMIPASEDARYVMTETDRFNLEPIALAWATNEPAIVVGDAGEGKTSCLRMFANKTETPYLRIVLSQEADNSVLMGRPAQGRREYDRAALEEMSEGELRVIAFKHCVDGALTEPVENLIAGILEIQEQDHFVRGPLPIAAVFGWCLVIDEAFQAEPGVHGRLASLFDDRGNLVEHEHRHEVITPDWRNFKIFYSTNAPTVAGRKQPADEMRSRISTINFLSKKDTDHIQILGETHPSMPLDLIKPLVRVHDHLRRLVKAREIGASQGGVAFTTRSLLRIADRFERFRGLGLPDDILLRREMEEEYLAGLIKPAEVAGARRMIDLVLGEYHGPDLYADLPIKNTADSFQIGDLHIRKLGFRHPLVPDLLDDLDALSPRMKKALYMALKAVEMGENLLLMGERATGKNFLAELISAIYEQPLYSQVVTPETDDRQLLGDDDVGGWQDALMLIGGRSTVEAPGVILLDEFNRMETAIAEGANSLFDDERSATLKNGDQVRLHPKTKLIVAMNPPTKQYPDRKKLTAASGSRFHQLYLPEIDSDAERLQIMQRKAPGVPRWALNKLIDLQTWISASFEDGLLGATLKRQHRPVYSIRQLIKGAVCMQKLARARLAHEPDRDPWDSSLFTRVVHLTHAGSYDEADVLAILAKAREVAMSDPARRDP